MRVYKKRCKMQFVKIIKNLKIYWTKDEKYCIIGILEFRRVFMRVITGSRRGKKLKTLDTLDTRPTTDMVKEAVFLPYSLMFRVRRCLIFLQAADRWV